MQMNVTQQISSHLKTRVPAFWVYTEEPGRIHDIVTEHSSERGVYRLDAINGLSVYKSKHKKWSIILVPDPMGSDEMVPITDISDAFSYVMNEGGIFMLEFAHKMAEAISGFVLSLQLEYREAVHKDSNSVAPMQLILISNEDTVNDEIARLIPIVNHGLPTKEEIEEITIGLLESYSSNVNFSFYSRNTGKLIAKSAVGLSESEIVRASLESLEHNREINPDHLNHYKLELLKNNGILEVRKPEMTLNDIGGMDNAKKLVKQISTVWNNEYIVRDHGVTPIRRVLMVGVAGSGKSMFCEAISSTLGLELAKGGVSSSMDKFVGQSEKNIRRMFETLKLMSPIVFWIDEFGRDLSGGASSSSVDGGTTDRVHGEFLTGIQELPDDILLVAAANRIQDLAPEMTRADRFDKIMFVGFPTFEERRNIFKIHLKHGNFNYDHLAEASQFFTGAEIKALVNEVKFNVMTSEHRGIQTSDILSHMPKVKGRIWVNHRDEVLEMYRRAKLEWDWASSSQMAEMDEVLNYKEGKITSYAPKQTPKVAKWGS